MWVPKRSWASRQRRQQGRGHKHAWLCLLLLSLLYKAKVIINDAKVAFAVTNCGRPAASLVGPSRCRGPQHGSLIRSAGTSGKSEPHVEARLQLSSEQEGRRLADYMEGIRGLATEALGWSHLEMWQRLEWAAALRFDAVPVLELPPWYLDPRNLRRQDAGVDLLSLDGRIAVQCKWYNGTIKTDDIHRFMNVAHIRYKVQEMVLVISPLSKFTAEAERIMAEGDVHIEVMSGADIDGMMKSSDGAGKCGSPRNSAQHLRPCQERCLKACLGESRVIEMACGSGKTRVMRELADVAAGRVLVVVPTRILLRQHMEYFPSFCPVGTGHNNKIDYEAPGFISVAQSVHLLQNITFVETYVDEAHHWAKLGLALPAEWPQSDRTYLFSATHSREPDFQYRMDEAIQEGVLRDYNLVVPIVEEGDAYGGLVRLLVEGAGHYRRVLAFCSSIKESRLFLVAVESQGLAAWHINGNTPEVERQRILKVFSGKLERPVHVLVTVQVLGEGVNVDNADTCLFVQPRKSFISIIQAIGRVLRLHSQKPTAHIILPAVASHTVFPGPQTGGF